MKQTAVALFGLLAASVGLEGVFLVAGTVLLAIGAGYLAPAGPWFVVGGVMFLGGIALALPQRTR